MRLFIGGETIIRGEDVVAIINASRLPAMPETKAALERAEKQGHMVTVTEDAPKSYIWVQKPGTARLVVYASPANAATLKKRAD